VSWNRPIPEPEAGVYVVARVSDPAARCEAFELPIIDSLPPNLVLDLEYERKRWLPNEPIVYIGATTRPLRKRLGESYRHKCGNPAPHAGGQVLKLLTRELWVYWSPAADPMKAERDMICAFREQTGQQPFANGNSRGKKRRIQRLE
jgi:hypothetical protein